MPDKPKSSTRSFPAALKQAAVVGLEAGEALAAIARDLGISRKVLYGWRALRQAKGAAELCHKRGLKPGLRQRRLAAALAPPEPAPPDPAEAVAKAQVRIGELERIIGRQQAGLDFFDVPCSFGTNAHRGIIMFDIVGDDISRLNDRDLRTLIIRLAIAELERSGAPQSAVIGGGDQNAADGGLDVLVELKGPLSKPDFVVRAQTGFQVKKSDMRVRQIRTEMRPDGNLRRVIGELADVAGAYIIVSAKGTVAHRRLSDRRTAMRNAVADHPNAERLLTDFYDRDRVANWVNQYVGVAAWVRAKIGDTISGWRPIGTWLGPSIVDDEGYLCDGTACLIDERSSNRDKMNIAEGIERIRELLRIPGHSTRLIGLSGLGKTRLIKALFEIDVGRNALDPALSVYTDLSGANKPTASEMASRLVDDGRRAILIIDNCNPATHANLTAICSRSGSKVSLITVEYDVRDDEPEATDVFRLVNASIETVNAWLKRKFKGISSVNRRRIAQFSDGNFRVAGALAGTLQRGETLGQLKDEDLFIRIIHQRNEVDRELQRDAEVLSLLYSFDGEGDAPDGELSRLAALAERSVQALHGSMFELSTRGIVQARGRWRAVLPQAIANRLAAMALGRLPSNAFDQFCSSLPPRMILSLSRRIGHLHDKLQAQNLAKRWLLSDGPLGDLMSNGDLGLRIIRNIAPIAPQSVLTRICGIIEGESGAILVGVNNRTRGQISSLLKAIAFDTILFDQAIMALARFVAVEPDYYRSNMATAPFRELFQSHYSGTQASPSQRRAVILKLCLCQDPGLQHAGRIALEALFTIGRYSTVSNTDFGARPRDYGWHPTSSLEYGNWYRDAIGLVLQLDDASQDFRNILARNLLDLWNLEVCRGELELAASTFATKGGWVQGWISFRVVLRSTESTVPSPILTRLAAVINRLKPTSLVERATAVVIVHDTHGFDLYEGEITDKDGHAYHKASLAAIAAGKEMANEPLAYTQFFPRVVAARSAPRAYEFGRGLAQGARSLNEIWTALTISFGNCDPTASNRRALGGFIAEAGLRDSEFVDSALQNLWNDSKLIEHAPYLEASASLSERGVARLLASLRSGMIDMLSLSGLLVGGDRSASDESMVNLFYAIADLENGSRMARDVFYTYVIRPGDTGSSSSPTLLYCGRQLLKMSNLASDTDVQHDSSDAAIVEFCLIGQEAAEDARVICENLYSELESHRIYGRSSSYLLTAIFKAQSEVALDVFFLNTAPGRNPDVFTFGFDRASPVESLDCATLRAWAGKDAVVRYPLLGTSISLFLTNDLGADIGLSPLFIGTLADAPDKKAFLGDGYMRFHASDEGGSLADQLRRRAEMLAELASDSSGDVREWCAQQLDQVDSWIDAAQRKVGDREESFE